jgi:hypothetical protein
MNDTTLLLLGGENKFSPPNKNRGVSRRLLENEQDNSKQHNINGIRRMYVNNPTVQGQNRFSATCGLLGSAIEGVRTGDDGGGRMYKAKTLFQPFHCSTVSN